MDISMDYKHTCPFFLAKEAALFAFLSILACFLRSLRPIIFPSFPEWEIYK